MTSSNGNIFRVTVPLFEEFTGHRWIPLTKASDSEPWCFLWLKPWINGWVNNHGAGDLRRYRAHYDVSAMHNHGDMGTLSAFLGLYAGESNSHNCIPITKGHLTYMWGPYTLWDPSISSFERKSILCRVCFKKRSSATCNMIFFKGCFGILTLSVPW